MNDRLEPNRRTKAWATTMAGHGDDVITAHADSHVEIAPGASLGREYREEQERAQLRPGATLSSGAGNRAVEEEPDPERTCFQRDRDRIVHSTPFRRLAGKTQAFVYPTDHQRTRLTHALEVAQIAVSIARGVGANVSLTDAIALGHDCGHGPGGHASEEAFDQFIVEGFDHGPWGADVALTDLNLCTETLDGIRNHSWSRPAPMTIEGEICSWADRIAYCCHDLEDAIHAGLLSVDDLPREITSVVGTQRREQLGVFVRAVIATTTETGMVGMDPTTAQALAGLRAFNYQRIYTRPDSLAQSHAVVELLRALVEFYLDHPRQLPVDYRDGEDRVHEVVRYVGGMTDRYAFSQAKQLLNWPDEKMPQGIV